MIEIHRPMKKNSWRVIVMLNTCSYFDFFWGQPISLNNLIMSVKGLFDYQLSQVCELVVIRFKSHWKYFVSGSTLYNIGSECRMAQSSRAILRIKKHNWHKVKYDSSLYMQLCKCLIFFIQTLSFFFPGKGTIYILHVLWRRLKLLFKKLWLVRL